MYGGAAGGGKSDALLLDAIRYVGRGYGHSYSAILFRRTFPEIERSLIERSRVVYPQIGGQFNETKSLWRFRDGETVRFGHLQHESDVESHLGAAYQFIGFDELTTFTKSQYIRLLGRCRSASGIPCRVRGATNPGSDGHEWVFDRWGAWLNPEAKVKAAPGETLYFLNGDDDIERVVLKGTPLATSRCFIPAKLEDNPFLFDDGKYAAGLQNLDPVTRKQHRHGDWLVKPGKGIYFKREWFSFCDASAVPKDLWRVRYWDRAATEAEKGKDPDWTVGAKLSLGDDGSIFIEDIARMRGNPGAVQAYIKATAEADGKDIEIGLEQEPGASGKADIASYLQLLAGWTARAFTKRNDKVVSAGPLSAQACPPAKKVWLVRAPWNEAFIQEAESFPEGSHDDQIDGAGGAYSMLMSTARPKRRSVGSWQRAPSIEDRTVGSD